MIPAFIINTLILLYLTVKQKSIFTQHFLTEVQTVQIARTLQTQIFKPCLKSKIEIKQYNSKPRAPVIVIFFVKFTYVLRIK